MNFKPNLEDIESTNESFIYIKDIIMNGKSEECIWTANMYSQEESGNLSWDEKDYLVELIEEKQVWLKERHKRLWREAQA